ncbi:MAG TPA: hypothetical protein VK211_12275 [Kamptonema sp.]|nr:hypothetical protein [Kamptonema sp.]
MHNFLRVILFVTLLSGAIIPFQKLNNSSTSQQPLQTSQKLLLAQDTTSGNCDDTPAFPGCSRRDSSGQIN